MKWFKHMSDMRHDLKIKRLFAKYGLSGYGLYNLIIESIVQSINTNSPLPLLEEDSKDLAMFYSGNPGKLEEETKKINEMTAYMINEGLFSLDEISTKIRCDKIYKFIESSMTKSESIRSLIDDFKKASLMQIDASINKNSIINDAPINENDASMMKNDDAPIKKQTSSIINNDNARQTSETFTENDVRLKTKTKTKTKDKEVKKEYAEFVFMTEKEFNALIEKHNLEAVNKMIEILDNYKGASGKKYKSDYRAILNWVEKKYLTENGLIKKVPQNIPFWQQNQINKDKYYDDDLERQQAINDRNNELIRKQREEGIV
jgi:hypothetical protein